MRQVLRIAAVEFRGINLELRIIIPRVAALLAARAEVQLRFCFCGRLGIGMRRGEQNAVAPRLEKSARRLADPRRNARGIARFQIEDEHLVERIARLAFALEDELLSIRRKISFAAAFALQDQWPRI